MPSSRGSGDHQAAAPRYEGEGNLTELVGTPDQVADALLDDYALGIRTPLIRGFDTPVDAIEYGRALIPCVKALVATRDGARKVAAA